MQSEKRVVVTVGLPIMALIGAMIVASQPEIGLSTDTQEKILVYQLPQDPIVVARADYDALILEKRVKRSAFAPLLSVPFSGHSDAALNSSQPENESVLNSKVVQNEPVILSSAAFAIDTRSGANLFEKNAEELRAPASTTKLLTALVALDLYALDAVITVPSLDGLDGARVGLFTGEQLRFEQLLYALLVQSGNDAALALARSHPLGEAAFVAAMNDKAIELGMRSTTVINATGYDHPQHNTTARDLAILGKVVMQHPLLRKIVATKEYAVIDVTGVHTHFVKNTNELLSDTRFVGIKTGTTDRAGEVLISEIEYLDRSIITVVMGSQQRYLDTATILNWIDSSYVWVDPTVLLDLYE